MRSNVVYRNDKAGIVFGGYAAGVGRVRDSEFRNNTTFENDTLGEGFGELWIQYAEDNVVRNNVFVSTGANLLLASYAGNANNVVDHNVWYAPGGAGAAVFVWNGDAANGFAAHRAATGQDAASVFADPLLVAPGAGDFHLDPLSPAINAGDAATTVSPGETDLDGAPRVSGPRVDAGADEVTCGDGVTSPGEQCDDGGTVDGDGCDSNCTFTACGNGVVTAGEQCDDGNTVPGDCCGASCQHEAAGSPCDDGNPCSNADACGNGACSGTDAPAPSCHAAARTSLVIRDQPVDTRDQLVWRWTRGDAVDLAELGNPAGGATSYALCVYATSAGMPALARPPIAIPGGGLCRGKPCWKALGAAGFKLTDRDRTPDGVESLLLRAGPAGKSEHRPDREGREPRAAGAAAGAGSGGDGPACRNDAGACFGASYAAPAQKSDAGQFRDKTP